MKTKYTYKILGQFDGVWIGMVPEVTGAASYAKDLNELIPLLDDAVKAIWAAAKLCDKPVNAELYTSHQCTDFGGPVKQQAYRFVTHGKGDQGRPEVPEKAQAD